MRIIKGLAVAGLAQADDLKCTQLDTVHREDVTSWWESDGTKYR